MYIIINGLNSNINKITQQNIDNIWTSIEAGILYAAKQNIPYKKIPNTTKRIPASNKKTKSPLHEDTISISKICQELKKLARKNNDQKAVLVLSSKRLQEIKSLLYKINTRHKTSINQDETASIKEWVQDFKGWLYIFNKKWASALEKEKNERIKELTDRHCLMIQDEQGKMLKSILDKPYSIARLDRVLEEIDNSYQLYTNPKDVLTKTYSFFHD